MPEAQPARNVETRSTMANAKRQEKTSESLEEVRPADLDADSAQSSQSHVDTATFSMPSPRTPKKIRRTEIPSSQSPADTPLSMRSRMSARSNSRSPLKQRSTNLPISRPLPPSTRRGTGRIPKLKVEDTYDYENEDSSRSARSRSSRQQSTEEYVAAGASFLQLLDHAEYFEGNNRNEEANDLLIKEVPDTETADVPLSAAHERESIKFELADSSVEVGDVGDEDDFNVRNDTQAALGAFSILSSQTRNQLQQPSMEQEEHNEPCLNNIGTAIEVTGSMHEINYESPQREPTLRTERSGRTTSSPQFQHSPAPGSLDSTTPKTSMSKEPVFPRSESEEASDQLTSDLVRLTQPCLIMETESQFQSAWREYSPPRNHDDEYQNQQEQEDQDLPHIPSDAVSADLPPQVRPSQATTVDITQSSPHMACTQHSSLNFRTQPRHLRSQLHPPEQLPSSSPPPQVMRSSSPVRDVELVWNGERLTDSQLLPDSLMNDSLPAPPPLTQESLDEGF